MNDDLDSAERNLEIDEDERESRQSRRGRLKEVIIRTKTKLEKVKQEREAKKQQEQKEKEKEDLNNSEDVNDFLAGGRTSFASSQRPSIGSEQLSPDTSFTAHPPAHVSASPRPSTSDSKSQPSPRRIVVPRIDVSASARFPNAKDVKGDVSVEHPDSGVISTSSVRSEELLKPDFKARNQSITSVASADRKARLRGLSVGFADVPPVIIGEGGDEAQAPTVEISRAKARARSASPQGRRPYTNANMQPEARRQAPTRGMSDNTAGAFMSKSFTRVQTGASLESNDSIGKSSTAEDTSVPKPFTRVQTGFLDHVLNPPQETACPLPARKNQSPLPASLQLRTGGLDLTKEFEMTLGLSPAESPIANKQPVAEEPQILAPKPKRVAPSYDLIEGGSKDQLPQEKPPSPPTDLPQRPSQVNLHIGSAQNHHPDQFHRKPAQAVQTQLPNTASSQAQDSIISPARTYNFPPPPPRGPKPNLQGVLPQMSAVLSNQNQHRMPPSETGLAKMAPQETGVTTSRILPPVHKDSDDGYRTFAERQRNKASLDPFADPEAPISMHNAPIHGRVPPDTYVSNPSKYSAMDTRTSATSTPGEIQPNKMRFYQSMKKGNPPGGFL